MDHLTLGATVTVTVTHMSKHLYIRIKIGQDLKEVKHGELQNQLSDKEMIIGDSTRQVLGNLNSGKQKKSTFRYKKVLHYWSVIPVF